MAFDVPIATTPAESTQKWKGTGHKQESQESVATVWQRGLKLRPSLNTIKFSFLSTTSLIWMGLDRHSSTCTWKDTRKKWREQKNSRCCRQVQITPLLKVMLWHEHLRPFLVDDQTRSSDASSSSQDHLQITESSPMYLRENITSLRSIVALPKRLCNRIPLRLVTFSYLSTVKREFKLCGPQAKRMLTGDGVSVWQNVEDDRQWLPSHIRYYSAKADIRHLHLLRW